MKLSDFTLVADLVDERNDHARILTKLPAASKLHVSLPGRVFGSVALISDESLRQRVLDSATERIAEIDRQLESLGVHVDLSATEAADDEDEDDEDDATETSLAA